MGAPFWQRRLPFAGLMGSAAAGILAAVFTSAGSGVFLAAFGVSLTVWLVRRNPLWIYATTAAAFAVLQIWQTRESPAAALAALIGEKTLPAEAVGIIIGEPADLGAKKMRFRLRLESLSIDGQAMQAACDVQAVIPKSAVAPGDTVRLAGSIQRINAPRNPAQFDARRVMAQRGLTCELTIRSPADIAILRPGSDFSLPRIASRCREWMEQTLRLGISDQVLECDLIAGLVLGTTADIPENLQNRFRRTGTYHLFSVSGLHVGMLAVILWQILRLAQTGRRTAVAIIIPALFFYALVTGWKPASVRAATMCAVFLAGMAVSRQQVPLNSLCAAGFAILVQSTGELFNPGFQLSFLVVAAILVFERPLRDAIRTRLRTDPFIPVQIRNHRERAVDTSGKWGAELLAVSVAAWLGSLPLTILFFGIVSLSALLANPIVVPISFLIMATSMGSLGAGLAAPWLSEILNNANLALVKILVALINAISSLPFAYIPVAPLPAPPPEVVVFDFGPGAGAAIRSQDSVWLIDCGSAWDFQNTVAPWLRQAGKTSPDGLVLTHGDADHIGGATELIPHDHPGILIDSPLADRARYRKNLHAALAAAGLPKSLHAAGDSVDIAPNASIHFLHPPPGLEARISDDKVLAARLDIEGVRILFLSDAGPSTAQWLLENQHTDITADILVVGRHKSRIMPDGGFLRAVNPSLAIASAAEFPNNEPVPPEWADLVRSLGIRLFRQDETGAVTIRPAAGSYTATGFMNASEFRGPPR